MAQETRNFPAAFFVLAILFATTACFQEKYDPPELPFGDGGFTIFPGDGKDLAEAGSSPNCLAIYSGILYFTDQGSKGSVKKVSVSGGTVTTLASDLSEPKSIVTDGSNVWFIDKSGDTGAVKKVSASGGPVVTVADGLRKPSALAIGPFEHLLQ